MAPTPPTAWRSPTIEDLTQPHRTETLSLQTHIAGLQDYVGTLYVIVADITSRNALTPIQGTTAYVESEKKHYTYNGTVWIQTTPEGVRNDDDGTTASTSFTDLTGSAVGPAVTLETGTIVVVHIGANLGNDNALGHTIASFAVTGASNIAAADSNSINILGQSDPNVGKTIWLTGLTAGSNTFTMKYRVTAGTGTFTLRNIVVQPILT